MESNTATNQKGRPRILIVGGVAGGASCAVRVRRLSESAEIFLFERGPHISFASCGLPYYVGDVIKEEKSLLVATPKLFKRTFNIEVRTRHEVLSINKKKQEIVVKNIDTGETFPRGYDALVLSTGSTPVRPPVPGVDLPGIFALRTINDSHQIRKMISERKARRAVVVGGGAIGLETCENLVTRGLSVTIIDMLPQVMPSLDPEMAAPLQEHLIAKNVKLDLGDGVARFDGNVESGVSAVVTSSGATYPADMVLLATGVRPEIKLAVEAGLEIGQLGGIRVDEQMHTSEGTIWAVGDAVEVRNFITGEWTLLPLAGPASRQGRVAADVILGRNSKFRGVQKTIVCKVFDITVAATGASEKGLQKSGISYEKIYLHPWNHAIYYPGSVPISMKLIFSTIDGRMLGAQAVGREGVERRIDVISMAIQKGSTVYDLEEAEMCYAPQFGSAKDPVNMAGMIATNVLRGDSPLIHWTDEGRDSIFLLDVREPFEFKGGHPEGAVNVPLSTLRNRLDELPKDKEIQVYCLAGQRSYYATRMLIQNGFSVKNISGG